MGDPHLPTIHFYPYKDPIEKTKATFAVWLQGVRAGQKLELVVFEVEKTKDGKGSEKELGRIKGRAVPAARKDAIPSFTIEPDGPPPPPPPETDPPKPAVAFVMPGRKEKYVFEIPVEQYDKWEGEAFTFEMRLVEPAVKSAQFRVAHVRRHLPVGELANYDWHADNEVKFFHHGSNDRAGSAGAFREIIDAIGKAKSFVFIVDWSFQAHFQIDRGKVGNDRTIGALLSATARRNPEMLIAVHAWDHTNIAAPDEQNDWGGDRLDQTAGGKRPANLLWRISSRTGFGWSHHQKFVVLDQEAADGRREIKVFFGGLDLTKGRFDWDKHPIMPDDPEARDFLTALAVGKQRRSPFNPFGSGASYDDWYNAEFGDDRTAPREPWHDIHGSLIGPAAWDVVREFVGRWNLDPSNSGAQGDKSAEAIERVNDKFLSLFKGTADKVPNDKQFVQQWEPRKKSPWAAQVYRSLAHEHWGRSPDSPADKWKARPGELQLKLKTGFERSIQDAYIRAIDHAEEFIYIETQYFISSGRNWGRGGVGNSLAERICARIVAKKGSPFHCFIVTPQYPEGDPVGSAGVAVRQYEWLTMQWMVSELTDKLGPNEWKKYLSFYFPVNWATVPSLTLTGDRKARATANKRYMIYVHSKLMIVDDRWIIFGSANLNERSLAGDRDSEICIGMWPGAPADEKGCIEQLKKFRVELMTEHLGKNPGLDRPAAAASAVQSIALANYTAYRAGKRAGEGPLARLPIEWDPAKKELYHAPLPVAAPDFDIYLPDWTYDKAALDKALAKARRNDPAAAYPDSSDFKQWLWSCPGNWLLTGKSIPE